MDMKAIGLRGPHQADVTSSSLNFLADFVRKMKPIYDAVLNVNNGIEESVRESHLVSPRNSGPSATGAHRNA